MQQEISSLEQRLKVVEQISVNQRRQQIDQTSKYLRWWPFPGLQPRAALVFLLWPVLVAWLFRYAANKRRRT
ncbi:hypothetical protein EB796_010396 [Bugula neritina]|uniref:Uncharacterized protein n=1 Tax=Bugula neritina TaxID=10212 RepID=A0A7J7K148_BUGNE|nr:hypothetical protein EB796_010396 [Bugula neritina]